MHVFEEIVGKNHEQVVYCHDKDSGLKAIVAIHNTVLGPALGGCRMWSYQHEDDALKDVLRLARGMTYKSALAGLNLGGGKSVIIGNPKTQKTPELFRAFGRFIQSLGGRYITAEDVGTSVQDMEIIREETQYVTGISPYKGGSGDPSPVTAYGVYKGILAAMLFQWGSESLKGKKVAVQGVGHVGAYLVEHLMTAGAHVYICDVDKDALSRVTEEFPRVEVVPAESIYDVEADIFAPCALGGVVNDATIPRLKCQLIAGSANNVLADEEKNAAALQQKNITYIPDYVISAGGIINVADELNGYDRDRSLKKATEIYNTVLQILQIAKNEHTTTLRAANVLAEQRIHQAAEKQKFYLSGPRGQ